METAYLTIVEHHYMEKTPECVPQKPLGLKTSWHGCERIIKCTDIDVVLTACCWERRSLAHPPNTNTSPSGPKHAVCHSLQRTHQHQHHRETAQVRGQMSHAPGPLRVLVMERSPLALTDAVQPGVACETDTLLKRVFGVTRCVRSASLTQRFSAGREAAEHKDVIRWDRSEGVPRAAGRTVLRNAPETHTSFRRPPHRGKAGRYYIHPL